MKIIKVLAICLLAFAGCKKELPPKAPVINGPNEGCTNVPINFTVSTTDPNKDDVCYLFNWGDGTRDSWTIYNASGQSVYKSHTFLKPGIFDVAAKAKDIKGNESEWSSFHRISISSRPPNTPSTPSGPTRGVINMSYTFSTSTADPDLDSIAYQFDWGDGTQSNWSDIVPSGSSVSMSKSWSSANTYLVKARAKDIYGDTSNWSSPLSITIIANQAPNTPSTPEGPWFGYGYTDSLYYFSSSTTDPDGDRVAIRFDWGDGIISQWSSWISSGESLSMSHSYLNSGLYLVRAQAKDVYGDTSNWSSPCSIYVLKIFMTEGFEGEFPGTRWTLFGTPTWDDESYRPYRGYWSGWCAGSTRTPPGPYPSSMNAWMIYGPFSLTDATVAYLDFWYWLDSEANYDFFFFGASTDGINFSGFSYSGPQRFWYEDGLDLTPYCGFSSVWIGFQFRSDETYQYEGAYLDDILLVKYSGPITSYKRKDFLSKKDKKLMVVKFPIDETNILPKKKDQ